MKDIVSKTLGELSLSDLDLIRTALQRHADAKEELSAAMKGKPLAAQFLSESLEAHSLAKTFNFLIRNY